MIWFIVWIILSVPFALLFAAFIRFGEKGQKGSDFADGLDPEFHDQTIVR